MARWRRRWRAWRARCGRIYQNSPIVFVQVLTAESAGHMCLVPRVVVSRHAVVQCSAVQCMFTGAQARAVRHVEHS